MVMLRPPGHFTTKLVRIFSSILLIVLGILSFTTALPTHSTIASGPTEAPSSSKPVSDSTSPQSFATAGAVPDLSMPETILSGVQTIVIRPGIIQGDAQNITIYNAGVKLRLLGGLSPHDQLLDAGYRVISTYSFWAVEVLDTAQWAPLIPVSNSFTILGTNSTGAYVLRTMSVSNGVGGGTFDILYQATPTGPLKWTLDFTASIPGQYRFVHRWTNLSSQTVMLDTVRKFRAGLLTGNYTLSWDDVPAAFPTTAAFSQGTFSLQINLGQISAGSRVVVDPSIIGSNVSAGSTAYSFQRKVFYEPTGGNYWVFFFDNYNVVYKYTSDGTNWSSTYQLPWGLVGATSYAPAYLPNVYYRGTSVLVVEGTAPFSFSGTNSISLRYSLGTISGTFISWGPVTTPVTISRTCSAGYTCTIGMRYVSGTINPDGSLSFSFNWYTSGQGIGVCSGSTVTSESGVFVKYGSLGIQQLSCNSGNNGYDNEQDRSVVLPANSQGLSRVVYEFHSGSTVQLLSRTVDQTNTLGSLETVDSPILDTDQFSVGSDADSGVHVIYLLTDSTVSYAYRSTYGASWSSVSRNLFSGAVSSISLTVDSSTGDLYSLALSQGAIAMRNKVSGGSWYDRSIVYPITGRNNPTNMGSNFASASATNANTIAIVWTEGTNPYTAMFASVPIQTVWSPYGLGLDPWDGKGLAPYGQYFSNLGEYVSPSSGMLTVRQTDLSLSGRGLDLAFTRVYTEPYNFLNGSPYNYETSFGFLDDSFPTSAWPVQTGTGQSGAFTSNNDVGTLTVTGSQFAWPNVIHYLSINTNDYPFLVWRVQGNAQYQVGIDVGGTQYKFSYPPDPPAPASWTTIAWDVRAATGGATVTDIKLWTVGNVATWTSFDFIGFTRATVGNGWQLNFPWMSTGQTPQFLHLWDGEGYRIPSTFWSGTTSAWDNHQGDQFRLTRNSTLISLYTKSATQYIFNATNNRLWKIFDSTSNNFILFKYDTDNRLASVTDTVSRIFQFCYDITYPMLLKSINQTSGNCSSGSGSLRGIVYGYDTSNLSLVSMTDAQGRVTSFQYQGVTDPNNKSWILSRLTYPTQSYTNYSYYTNSTGGVFTTYRVYQQLVSSPSAATRRFDYRFSTLSGGDQVTNSTIQTFDGAAGSLQSAGYTHYAFSFVGVTMNNTDASNRLLNGVQQKFNLPGQIPREVNLVASENKWYFTTTSPASGWASQTTWFYDSSWNLAYAVANETQVYPPWGPLSGWSDTSAKWIWANAAGATLGIVGPVWFRTSFYQPKATTGSMEIMADGSYTAYLNGANIGTGSLCQSPPCPPFTKNTISNLQVNAGWNVLAVYATNTDGPDPAGLILSLHDSATNLVLVRTDASLGSYVNYARYDLWGNQIYSQNAINPAASWNHEAFSAFYNAGMQTGFYAFRDTFSQANYTRPDEVWSTYNGTWVTRSGVAFRDPSFNQGGWTQEVNSVTGQSQTLNGETDQLTATFTSGTPGYYRIYQSFATPIDGNLYSKVVVRLQSTVAKNLLRIELRDGSTYFDPTDGTGDLWKKSTGWTTAVLNIQGHSNINLIKLGISSEADTSISGTQSGYFDYVFIANDVPASQDDMLGQYSGAEKLGAQQEATFVWADLGKADITMQARIFITKQIATSDQRVGLIAHYPGTGVIKWGMVLHNTTSGVNISLLEEGVAWRTENSCSGITMKNWYTFNFTMRGLSAIGSIIGPGVNCTVSGTFGTGQVAATGFGLYAGGYAALFDNLAVATVFPYPSNTGFSNSFTNTPPRVNVRNSVAGHAELSNSTGSIKPIESYYSYTGFGAVSQVNMRYDPVPGTVQWITSSNTYDSFGNLIQSVDPRGNSTYYTFSTAYSNAYLTNQTKLDASTKVTSLYAYNFTTGNVQSTTDPNGNTISYQNDNLGRTKYIAYPLSAFSQNSYNDRANYVDITNENGWKTRQIYDGLARQTTNDRFLGSVSYSNETIQYDWGNRLISRTDALGNIYKTAYDLLGRVTNQTAPNGKSVLIAYNDLYGWVRTVDQDGNYRCNGYDRLSRLTSVIERSDVTCAALSFNNNYYVTNYAYDEVGNLIKVSRTASLTNTYDNLNRKTSTTYADNTSESFTYDSGSNLVKKVDRNGNKTLYGYDSINRVKTITFCGTPIVSTSYAYDKSSNLVTLQNQNGTVSYIYDARNRMTNETYNINTVTSQVVDLGCLGSYRTWTVSGGVPKLYTLGLAYNGEVLDSIMLPTTYAPQPNIDLKYTYDGLGRVLAVSQSGTSTYYAQSTTYNKNDKILGFQYGNGLILNYTYDSLSRPASITLSGSKMSLSYSYNNTGTVASVTGQVNSATVNERYSYDPFQRLTNAVVTSNGATTTSSYQYDNAGNMLSQTVNGTATTYSYNTANNELTSSSVSGTTVTYAYDYNGNMKAKNVTTGGTVKWTYRWDVGNHLLSVSNGSPQGTYAYDGLGRRVETIEASVTCFYAYTGSDIVFKNISGQYNVDYFFLGPIHLASLRYDINQVYYYHPDALGSTRLATTSSATVQFADGYQPFGQDNGTPTGTETYKFTGKPYSSTTGLYYYYHRWFDPSIGRFISEDPRFGEFSAPQSLNRYVYVQNNPAGSGDPTGECPACIGAIAGGLIGWGYCAWQAGSAAALFTAKCAIQGGIGAATGGLAGATFGLSLLGTSALGIVAGGALSGAIGGLATFDLNSIGYDLTHGSSTFEAPTVENAILDVGLGALTGAIGGAVDVVGAKLNNIASGAVDSASSDVKGVAAGVRKLGAGIVTVGKDIIKDFSTNLPDPIIREGTKAEHAIVQLGTSAYNGTMDILRKVVPLPPLPSFNLPSFNL